MAIIKQILEVREAAQPKKGYNARTNYEWCGYRIDEYSVDFDVMNENGEIKTLHNWYLCSMEGHDTVTVSLDQCNCMQPYGTCYNHFKMAKYQNGCKKMALAMSKAIRQHDMETVLAVLQVMFVNPDMHFEHAH